MIDLHTHSTFSDGTLTPTELLELAEQVGLYAVALTDHDTVSGIEEALDAAAGKSVRFVPGVEISGEIDRGALHILGLFADHRNNELREMLAFAETQRINRNIVIVERLRQLGMDITVDEVKAEAGEGVMGRPHFAALMIRKGYVSDMEEAFVRYLAKGGAAFVPKVRIPREKAVAVIRRAGGVPVLAHPDQTGRGGAELTALLTSLKNLGLLGMETHYSGYAPNRVRKYSRSARALGLLESGGSDFHGSVKPTLHLGEGPGSLNVPDEFYDRLHSAAQEIQKAV